MYNRDYEDWHRYGKDRGFFDRASDEVRSWFGDQDAEQRRRIDAQMRGTRDRDRDRDRARGGWFDNEDDERVGADLPEWQRRSYSGASPRGGELEERGRFDMTMGEGRERGGRGRYGYGGERGYGTERRYDEERYGREDYGIERRGGYGAHVYGGQREFESPGPWGYADETEGGYRSPQRWQREARQPRRGLFGGEHRGGFFGGFGEREREQEERSDVSRSDYRGRGPRNYQRADERISDEIHMILTMHPQIDASDIEVIVEKGIVTLRGAVENRWTKRTVEDIAEDVYGVREVHNELRVLNTFWGRGQSSNQQVGNDNQTQSKNLLNR